jgi:predicted DsbA family dithiol-disulfide isomerase
MTETKPPLKVSVFSDYICPFCYIGSRRLLRLRDTYNLQVNWCALEIHPETPAEGMPIARLGYPPAQWQRMMSVLQDMARAEQLDLQAHDFTTNSHRALLLAEAAKEAGREVFYGLHERLFDAFFREGRNIGDPQVLRTLAGECLVPEPLIEAAWNRPRYEQRLALNLRHAAEIGVRGTPTYVFGTRILVGAVAGDELRRAAHAAASDPVR